MRRALVLYCHPNPGSYTAAIKDRILARLDSQGHEVRVIDLYAEGFEPRLTQKEHAQYLDTLLNREGLEAHVEALEWCDTLICVYPTWWYGLPAMLKGWLDRVLLPGVAFELPPDGRDIRPLLTNIARLGVFTTAGASWWLTRLVGAPGRRTVLRGVRFLCARQCRTAFVAHYNMDASTPQSRTAHLQRVDRALDKLIG